ncbi:MAG: hypothetical protein P8M79_10975 [Alphaproteobacteria bacterium]|nr:hypothetical protein [Alphaproteobacteria bacterium]
MKLTPSIVFKLFRRLEDRLGADP